MIRDIAGRHNHTVKLARKLQKKKHRRERGLIVGEGMDLLRAAVAAGAEFVDILVRRELLEELPSEVRDRAGRPTEARGATGSAEPLDLGLCSQEVLDYASSLGGSADVIFICRRPQRHLSSLPLEQGVLFYLDDVGDPGNVGTLCRSAVAFGLAGVVCSPATADPYSPKALRAGMGAQFTLPVVTDVTPEDLEAYLGGAASTAPASTVASLFSFVVADPHTGVEVDQLAGLMSQKTGCLVVVLGEERFGPRHGWPGATRVTIPQAKFDSLNVAMAGTILAYELWRARRPGQGSEGGNQWHSPIGLTPWRKESAN